MPAQDRGDPVLDADPDRPAAIAGLGPWFHNLHLPDGRQTAPEHPLGDFPSCKWRQIAGHVPADLNGWRVLDVGCNAGFYSFELARRGALVTAIDIDERYLRQARWAAAQFGLEHRIEFRRQQVYALAGDAEMYDLVWFMGVFYHLRYPQLALDVLARRTRRLMVFQTLTMPGERVCDVPPDLDLDDRDALLDPGWPKLAFLERAIAGDPTNWWAPNHACVEALLRTSGLESIARPAHEVYLCRPVPRRDDALGALLDAEYRAATRTM